MKFVVRIRVVTRSMPFLLEFCKRELGKHICTILSLVK